MKPRLQKRAVQAGSQGPQYTHLPVLLRTRTSLPPTNSDSSLLLRPSPHLSAACGAHDQLRIPRHVGGAVSRSRLPHSNYQESDCHAPLSLRATPTEFRVHNVRTNHNPNPIYVNCSATLPTTERPAGQIQCETRPGKTPEREGDCLLVLRSGRQKYAVGK